IVKRDEREKVHPGRYGVPGGKLEWKELDILHPTRMNGDVYDFENAVEKLLIREAMEEAGIEIDDNLKYINSVAFIRPDEVPVVLVKFTAKYKRGEVKPEVGGFTDYAWVNEEEVKDYPCIDGVPEEVAKTIEIFKNGRD
ncbi:MAG: NUDIX domain-containing protein, partial [Parcubacteria group bacterium]